MLVDEGPVRKALARALGRRLLTVLRSVVRRARAARACRMAYYDESGPPSDQPTISISPLGYPSGSTREVEASDPCWSQLELVVR